MPFAPQVRSRFRGRGPDRALAGRAGRPATTGSGAARGVPVIGELELASWFLRGADHRHHRIERQDHHDRADRPHSANPASRCRWAATSARRPRRWWRPRAPDQWNVLELSSFQLETIETFRAHIGVASTSRRIIWTGTTRSKVRRRQGAAVRNAAARRFRRAERRRSALRRLRRPDGRQRPSGSAARARSRLASGSRTARILLDGEPLMEAAEIPLRGLHNLENTMAAAAAAQSGRRAPRPHRERRADVSAASSTGSSSCARSTASTSTTIPKPPTSTRRSRLSRRSRAGCG